jgi:hypothetical protein
LKSKIVDKYHINGLEKIISERSIEETEGQYQRSGTLQGLESRVDSNNILAYIETRP